MTMTTKSARHAHEPSPDDHKPCIVDVTPGVAVYWQGDQREGTIHDVPKHIAMEWLRKHFARVVYEPKDDA